MYEEDDVHVNVTAQKNASELKKYTAAITKMLKIWLAPLRALTGKRIIGADDSDFVYKKYENKKEKHVRPWFKTTWPKITDQSEHVLHVAFQCSEHRSMYDPSTGGITCNRNIDKLLGKYVLLHELGHAFGLLDTY